VEGDPDVRSAAGGDSERRFMQWMRATGDTSLERELLARLADRTAAEAPRLKPKLQRLADANRAADDVAWLALYESASPTTRPGRS